MAVYSCSQGCEDLYRAFERGRSSVIRTRVYCRNCKHHISSNCDKGHNPQTENFYCSDGERIEHA